MVLNGFGFTVIFYDLLLPLIKKKIEWISFNIFYIRQMLMTYLANHKKFIKNSSWLSLPEMTNSNGILFLFINRSAMSFFM
jgi:hypothetical protein